MRTATAQHATDVPSVPTGVPGERLPVVASGPDAFGWWGMWGLIATEAMLFGSLLASYFYLRFRSGAAGWPPDGIHKPELVLPHSPAPLGERFVRFGEPSVAVVETRGPFFEFLFAPFDTSYFRSCALDLFGRLGFPRFDPRHRFCQPDPAFVQLFRNALQVACARVQV